MLTCAICECREGLSQLMSRLGTSPVCFECFEIQAESPAALNEFMRANKPWKGMAKEVTCWAGPDFGYMNLKDYERHISRNMLRVIKPEEVRLPPEEEEAWTRLDQCWNRVCVVDKRDLPPPMARSGSWLAKIKGLFLLVA